MPANPALSFKFLVLSFEFQSTLPLLEAPALGPLSPCRWREGLAAPLPMRSLSESPKITRRTLKVG